MAAGHNVTVFHNIDFVATFGNPGNLTVDVIRNGVTIGRAAGPTVPTPDGPALEVNHGPLGAPAPGDCFTGYTPDIGPNDTIRVTNNDAVPPTVDEVIVDDIGFSGDPVEDALGNVRVDGWARRANGDAIPTAFLDSAEFRAAVDPQLRGAPDQVIANAAEVGGFTMIYEDPWTPDRNSNGLNAAEIKAALLGDGHAAGFGHVAPLPLESMLVDGLTQAPGPALGCEGEVKNSIIGADDGTVNANSGDLVVNGGRNAPTVDVNVTVTDSDGTQIGPFAAVPAGGAWDVTVPRAQLLPLAEGALTVSASYTGGGGNGNTLDIEKDTVAPVVPAAVPVAGPVAQAVQVIAPALAPAAPRVSLNVSRSSYRLARSARLRSVRRNGVRVRYTAPAGANRMQFAVYRSSGASARRALVKRTVRVRPGQRSIALKWRGMRAGRYVLEIRALRNGQAGRTSKRSFRITR